MTRDNAEPTFHMSIESKSGSYIMDFLGCNGFHGSYCELAKKEYSSNKLGGIHDFKMLPNSGKIYMVGTLSLEPNTSDGHSWVKGKREHIENAIRSLKRNGIAPEFAKYTIL